MVLPGFSYAAPPSELQVHATKTNTSNRVSSLMHSSRAFFFVCFAVLHLPFGPTLDTTQCLIPDLDSISARLQYYGCGTISWLLRDQQSSSPVVLSSQPLPDPSCPSHLNVPITCLRL